LPAQVRVVAVAARGVRVPHDVERVGRILRHRRHGRDRPALLASNSTAISRTFSRLNRLARARSRAASTCSALAWTWPAIACAWSALFCAWSALPCAYSTRLSAWSAVAWAWVILDSAVA